MELAESVDKWVGFYLFRGLFIFESGHILRVYTAN
jgi:hypothetical protein